MDIMIFRSRRRTCPLLPRHRTLGPELLEPRMMLSTIQVIAAGVENTESMDLLIDDVVVQSWDNIGGNAYANQYETFTFTTTETVTAGQIKVAFTNDLYIPGQTDRNLGVDAIVIDGQRFETEDPSVYGTGTWIPSSGAVVPGYNETEILNANGYFQYADPLPANGSQIVLAAAGYENEETMQLLIGGTVVQTWTNVAGDGAAGQFVEYTYTHSSSVTIDQVRVRFTNDLYIPGQTDRNLRLDFVRLDGVVYETEDPTVYSTGTWLPNDGITPGYRQNEHLHANGYFQFAETGNLNPGVFSLETSVISVNENDATLSISILRSQGSDGTVTVDYRTVEDTATAGEDYQDIEGTLTFFDGQTVATATINLLDNGIAEPTESFTFTIDNPQGGATLLAPRTALITITDDDVILPDFPDFNSTSGLTLNGTATGVSGELLLTPATDNQTGSVFFNESLPVNADTSFQTAFRMRIDGGQGSSGGDGMAFVLHNDPAGPAAVGQGGGSLGYGGIGNSLAVEFDTWKNGSGDINNNHVSILVNGDTVNAVASAPAGLDLNAGAVVHAWIDYNGLRDEMAVYLSSSPARPETPVLFTNIDLRALVGDSAFLGFAAATGGSYNRHWLLDWSMNLEVPPVVGPPGPGDELVSVTVLNGLVQPTAVNWSPDGSNMYIAEKSGVVKVVRDGVLQPAPFADISGQVNNVRDRGLLDIAVHPDFENNPYLYLLYTYDPPEVYDYAGDPLAGPDRPGNRAGRLMRVEADPSTNYTTIVPGSEVILLGTNSTWENFNAFANSTSDFSEPPAGILPDGTNIQDFIASDSESHTVGGMDFGPDGALYVSIGDGTSYNQVDPRTVRVQDIDNLSGKVLRIDPLTGQGLPDNPFFDGDPDANRSKVYYYGLRNPFRIAVNQETGDVFVGDVGWGTWEEVNVGPPGTNFGWPYYEGASGTNNKTGGYRNLPEAIAFYDSGQIATPAIYALNHSSDGINAIVLGDSYNGQVWPAEYDGDVFLNDLGGGIVRNLSFNADGSLAAAETFTTGAQYYVMMRQGPDGHLYWVDLVDGRLGRWEFV
jgi:glucose/arabinose dehydrogenase